MLIKIILILSFLVFITKIYQKFKILKALHKKNSIKPSLKGFLYSLLQIPLTKKYIIIYIAHISIFLSFIYYVYATLKTIISTFHLNTYLPDSVAIKYTASFIGITGILIFLGRRIIRYKFLEKHSSTNQMFPSLLISMLIVGIILSHTFNNEFLHLLFFAVILIYLPYTKHIHIIFAPFVRIIREKENLYESTQIDFEKEDEIWGIEKVKDIDYTIGIGALSCVECGRCIEVCPSYNKNTEISPKKLITYTKVALNTHNLNGKYDWTTNHIFDCTTCGACTYNCPLKNHHLGIIINIRRNIVLEKGNTPKEQVHIFKNLEKSENPWGIRKKLYDDEIREIAIIVEENITQEKYDYFYFRGCFSKYDKKYYEISKKLIKIFNHFGIKLAISNNEVCCGDIAQKLGEEYLFQELLFKNISLFKKYNINKIITSCPHGYHILKTEYTKHLKELEIYYYTEILLPFIKQSIRYHSNIKAIIHDSCYLYRHTKEKNYRKIINQLGIKILELPHNKGNSLCCGGGSGGFLTEKATKIANQRKEEIFDIQNSNNLIVMCPICYTMLKDENYRTFDLIDVVYNHLFSIKKSL